MRYLLSTAAVALAMTATAMPASAQQQQQQQQAQQQQQVTCDRNFSAVDANGDGQITNEEASAAVGDEFSRLDLDNSGNISKSEWQNCGWHTMMNTQRKNMQAADHAPMKGDSQQTGQQAAQSGDQSGGQSGGQTTQQTGQSASTATLNQEGPPRPWTTDEQFSQADTNKDGVVDREEAAQATEEIYGRTVSGDQKEQMARQSGARFATIDSDGDGSISQEEWQNRAQADIEAMFQRIDRDDNDQISQSEYQRVRRPQQEASRPVTIWYYYVY